MLTITAPDAWRAISPVSSTTWWLPNWNDLVTFAIGATPELIFTRTKNGAAHLREVRPRMAALISERSNDSHERGAGIGAAFMEERTYLRMPRRSISVL